MGWMVGTGLFFSFLNIYHNSGEYPRLEASAQAAG